MNPQQCPYCYMMLPDSNNNNTIPVLPSLGHGDGRAAIVPCGAPSPSFPMVLLLDVDNFFNGLVFPDGKEHGPSMHKIRYVYETQKPLKWGSSGVLLPVVEVLE